jgi:hypothetical protein
MEVQHKQRSVRERVGVFDTPAGMRRDVAEVVVSAHSLKTDRRKDSSDKEH